MVLAAVRSARSASWAWLAPAWWRWMRSARGYRERYGGGSGAKSDPGDAKVLADLVRTDRHNHRQVADDSELAWAIKVLARAQQQLVWSRERQVNGLRSILREFCPAALAAFADLDDRDALAVLGRAPAPAEGRRLSRSAIAAALTCRPAAQRRMLERPRSKPSCGPSSWSQPPCWPAATGQRWPPRWP
jgi:transposase